MNDRLAALARACVSLVFLFGAYSKLTGWRAVVALLAGKGVPFASLVLGVAIAVELTAALAFLAGYRVRWASMALLVLLVLATILFEVPPILGPDRDQAWEHTATVLKHLAIMGGLISFYIGGSRSAPVRTPAPQSSSLARDKEVPSR